MFQYVIKSTNSRLLKYHSKANRKGRQTKQRHEKTNRKKGNVKKRNRSKERTVIERKKDWLTFLNRNFFCKFWKKFWKSLKILTSA